MQQPYRVGSTNASVYFDNCLVGAIVNGDHPSEIDALALLLDDHERGSVDVVASTEVLGEIRSVLETYRRPHLEVWNRCQRLTAAPFEWEEGPSSATARVVDPDYQALSQILPDEMDRRHVHHAIKNGVTIFATVDRRTILSRVAQIEAKFPIRFGTPSQVVEMLGLSRTPST
ncbi:MAG: hypothetical protein ABW110_17470 [Steroidobacteraceae bacterium]